MRFGHLSDDILASVRSTRVYLTRHLPPMGFLNPTAVYSADIELTLFHASTVCEIQDIDALRSAHLHGNRLTDSLSVHAL
jgi:hypothetical protein